MSFNDNNYFEEKLKGDPLFEMGNNSASNSPFKDQSQFYTNVCGEFKDSFYEGVTNYEGLVNFLSKKNNLHFKWDEYTSSQTKVVLSGSPGGGLSPGLPSTTKTVVVDTPFNYEDNGVAKQGVFDQAFLNERICSLDSTLGYQLTVNPKNRVTKFVVSAFYANTDEFRTYGDVGFTIEDKYRAVKLITADVNLFYNFAKRVNNGDLVKGYLTNTFNDAYRNLNRTDKAEVNWFYTQVPDFFINQVISKEDLWTDLKTLLQYDASKWFVDNSSNMIRAIKAIIAQDATKTFLYNNFYQNPKLIKDIYYSLDNEDTSSLHDGQKVPNKSIFASLLLAITYDYYLKTKQAFVSNVSLQIDDTHRVDSNLFVSRDSSDEKYDLTQEFLVTSKETEDIITPGFGRTVEVTKTEWKKGTTHSLHPLDLVNFTIPLNEKESMTVPFPAIMVKDIVHHAEWEEAMEAIRFAGNIVAIVFGGAALLSGNPFLIILAIADIGLASTDIYVQVRKDEYMKTPEGRAFLDTWEKVYTIGGLGIALVSAPQLIKSLLSSGASLLKSAAKATEATRNFLKQVVVSIILEINIANASKAAFKSVDIGAAIFKNAPVQFSTQALKRLEEKGVIFARLEDLEGVESYSAVYNGEVLVQSGSAAELKGALKSAWGKTGTNLEQELVIIKTLNDYDAIKIPIGSSNKYPRGKGILGAQKLNRDEIRKWTEKIYKISNGEVSVGFYPREFFENLGKDVQAAFDPFALEVQLQAGLTRFLISHEFKHLEEYMKIGRVEYLKGIDGSLAEREIRRYLRERYVFDELMKESKASIK